MTTTVSSTHTRGANRSTRPRSASCIGRSAAIGDSRAARKAGTSDPARVTSSPSPKAATRPMGGRGRPVTRTERVVPRNPIMAAARTIPATTPARLPITPRASAWRSTIPSTCLDVVPAARSRPSSRVRSPTVMASVLPTRNAPTTSATRPNSSATPTKPACADANR